MPHDRSQINIGLLWAIAPNSITILFVWHVSTFMFLTNYVSFMIHNLNLVDVSSWYINEKLCLQNGYNYIQLISLTPKYLKFQNINHHFKNRYPFFVDYTLEILKSIWQWLILTICYCKHVLVSMYFSEPKRTDFLNE